MSVDAKLVKVHLLQAAYVGAAAVFQHLPPDDASFEDLTFQNKALRQRAVDVYEEAKIQYAALKAAFEDNTVWPDPVVPSTAAVVTPKAAVGLPGQDIGANLAGVAGVVGTVTNALAPVVPQAGLAAGVANAVAGALAPH